MNAKYKATVVASLCSLVHIIANDSLHFIVKYIAVQISVLMRFGFLASDPYYMPIFSVALASFFQAEKHSVPT